MAITRTTLSAAASKDTDTFYLTSAANAAAGTIVKLNNEYSTIVRVDGTAVRVRSRGQNGGRAIAHANLSPVMLALASDLAPYITEHGGLASELEEITMSADGAIAIPVRHTRINIMKGSIAVLTLTAPGATVLDGIELQIHGVSLFAHTVTLTAGFYGNTTASDVATFAAGGGACLSLETKNGLWAVRSGGTVGVTFA